MAQWKLVSDFPSLPVLASLGWNPSTGPGKRSLWKTSVPQAHTQTFKIPLLRVLHLVLYPIVIVGGECFTMSIAALLEIAKR